MAIHAQNGLQTPNPVTTLDVVPEIEDALEEGEKPKRGRGRPKGSKGNGYLQSHKKMEEGYQLVHVSDDEAAAIERVAKEVIFGRQIRVYNDDPADATKDTPTLMFRMLIDRTTLHTFKSACALIGVTEQTGYEWLKKHPRFRLAAEMGKCLQEHFHASRMAQGIMYPTSLIFTMKNVHGWADKMESVHRVSVTALIAEVENKAKPVDWENPDLSMVRLPSGTYAIPKATSPESISNGVGTGHTEQTGDNGTPWGGEAPESTHKGDPALSPIKEQ